MTMRILEEMKVRRLFCEPAEWEACSRPGA